MLAETQGSNRRGVIKCTGDEGEKSYFNEVCMSGFLRLHPPSLATRKLLSSRYRVGSFATGVYLPLSGRKRGRSECPSLHLWFCKCRDPQISLLPKWPVLGCHILSLFTEKLQGVLLNVSGDEESLVTMTFKKLSGMRWHPTMEMHF